MTITPEELERIADARTRGEAPEEEHEQPAETRDEEETEEVNLEAEESDREDELSERPTEPEPLGEGEPSRKQLTALDAEQRRHFGRITTIMGGYVAGFEECEHCSGVGLVPPGPKPQTHDYFRACQTCAGFGEVLTGSRRAGQESRDCPTCAGRGYVEKLDESGMPVAGAGGAAGPANGGIPAAPPTAATGEAGAAVDAQGYGVPQWMGDPSLGRG